MKLYIIALSMLLLIASILAIPSISQEANAKSCFTNSIGDNNPGCVSNGNGGVEQGFATNVHIKNFHNGN
jgi:hypothetical protein